MHFFKKHEIGSLSPLFRAISSSDSPQLRDFSLKLELRGGVLRPRFRNLEVSRLAWRPYFSRIRRKLAGLHQNQRPVKGLFPCIHDGAESPARSIIGWMPVAV